MKKVYIKPETTVVALNVRDNVLQATSTLKADEDYGGLPVQSREVIQTQDAWDNEW